MQNRPGSAQGHSRPGSSQGSNRPGSALGVASTRKPALSIALGCIVDISNGKSGTVRYIGAVDFAAGEFVGIELPDETGKNDGTYDGRFYFECLPQRGIFVRETQITRIRGRTSEVFARDTRGSLSPPRQSINMLNSPESPDKLSKPPLNHKLDLSLKLPETGIATRRVDIV